MTDIIQELQKEKAKINEVLGEKMFDKYIEGFKSIREILINILAEKLEDQFINKHELTNLFNTIFTLDKSLEKKILIDLNAYFNRDFACENYYEVILFFRGFLALEAYRMGHALYENGDKISAKWLQNRIFEKFAIDIHPAAEIGVGLVIDHGIGVVIGETSKIGDHVFIFHNVTLGGTGKSSGDRHPKISSGVVIGAGATVLGNIKVGKNANIAAGAVVLKNVPKNTTVAGIPAQEKGLASKVQIN